MDKVKIKQAIKKTANNFGQFLPMMLGVFLLLNLVIRGIPKEIYTSIFSGNALIDPLIGAIFGSVSVGHPVTSYIIGGELLKEGISFIAITAFILSWVSVGVIQLPLESSVFGKKFAIARNALSFIGVLIISILTVFTLSLI